ncbi:anti-sigma-D factor RsdA [Rhodococcus phenolicus]|uniref:anti-sigma-D factor RsdA n=1 Tax=Rhodococcus phenolicus TaxID=263849 RepID=UPI0008302158|nr:anti-sigma-D factor RsdA [Rhodococcus phenolicus]
MGRKRGDDDFHADLADDGTPVDIAAVRRDDALIDAISGDGPVTTESDEEYELATLLAGWRAEILAEPLPAGPELDEIVAAVNREIGARDALTNSRTRSRTQLRLLRPIAGAAALVAVAVGTAAAVSYSAEPGDPLWGVKEVVFSEQAQSTVARIDTTSSLEQAERAIAAGDTAGAQELLASAQVRSSDVADAGQRDELGNWLERLADELSRLVPVPPSPVPGQPLPPLLPPFTPPQSDAATIPQTPGTTWPGTSASTPTDALTQPSPSPTTDPTILNEPTTVPSTPPVEPSTRPTTTPPAPSSEPSTPPTTEAPPTTTASASASTTSLEQQSISQPVTRSPESAEVR